MDCKIEDIEGTFNGEIVENLGNNEYVIKLNDREQNLKILNMDARGIEFVLDQKYHKVKYLESGTSKMNLVVDGVPMTLNLHANLDEIVYKNVGGGGPAGKPNSWEGYFNCIARGSKCKERGSCMCFRIYENASHCQGSQRWKY